MFFALLGGLSVFGALGVVLGPVAFATAAAIVETLREPGGGVGQHEYDSANLDAFPRALNRHMQ